ncbi:MAG TPA: tetratricopeptide repeat protein, partial [Ktedonobacterales bacterium]|nr:tetratricopeptide repeat protein [Ktedonobacterales bacterium]
RAELAEKIRVGVHSIYRWEEKGHKINEDAVKALIRLFGKPVEAWGKTMWKMPYLPNAYFTGREQVLKYLNERLGVRAIRDPGRLPVAISQPRAISGLGGIGKTQTAVEYAYRFRDEYDMVVLVHASEREVLVGELAALASLLGLPTYAETNQERLAEAVKHWLETQKEQVWLLIFDNVEDFEVVKKFLPEKGDGAVLLTTRLQAVGTHIRKVSLNTLTLEEGITFFQERVGTGVEPGQKTLPEPERRDAAELAALLGGLPLALEQAAAYIEEYGCSLAEYVTLYTRQRATFLQMQKLDPNDYRASVATTWLISFQRVEEANPDAVLLLRLLAFLHPDAIPEDALLQGAAEVGPPFQTAAENAPRLQAAIEILQRYSLIRYHQPTKTLTIHRLVQAVIQDSMEEAEQHTWRERAMLAVNAAFPIPEEDTWEQCERLLPHALLAAHSIGQQSIVSQEAGRLLHETASYLQRRARHAEAEPLFQRALQIREQLLGPEHLEVAASLNGLADLYRERGKQAEAEPLFKRALDLRERLLKPEDVLVAISWTNLANLYQDQGRYAEAEPLYLRARDIFQQQVMADHRQDAPAFKQLALLLARLLSNLGAMYLEQDRLAECEPLLRNAIQMLEQHFDPDSYWLADPLNNLAILSKNLGRWSEAEPLYQRSLHIWEQHFGPEHSRVALAANNLGEFYKEQGRYAEAEEHYQQALRIWEQRFGAEHFLVGVAFTNLADNARQQGKDNEAEQRFQQGLSIFDQGKGPPYYRAHALHGLANLYREQKRYTRAELLYQQALEIRKQAWEPPHPDIAESLHDLAQLREAQGNLSEAKTLYEEALHQREQAFGIDHPKTVETRYRLIALLHIIEKQGSA